MCVNRQTDTHTGRFFPHSFKCLAEFLLSDLPRWANQNTSRAVTSSPLILINPHPLLSPLFSLISSHFIMPPPPPFPNANHPWPHLLSLLISIFPFPELSSFFHPFLIHHYLITHLFPPSIQSKLFTFFCPSSSPFSFIRPVSLHQPGLTVKHISRWWKRFICPLRPHFIYRLRHVQLFFWLPLMASHTLPIKRNSCTRNPAEH